MSWGEKGEKTGKPPRGEGKEKTEQPLRGKNRRKAKVRFQFRKDGKESSFLSNLHNRPKVRMGTPYDQGFALWRGDADKKLDQLTEVSGGQ
ncbi:hypothetical protein, partial [Dialister hominis]|uniref:hypothetical protein n=1 Tax=Dialister hominis TaxID=2582419 RepID=UPI0040285718